MSASSVFLAPQHSLATSSGIAASSLELSRNASSSSIFVIRISVDASKTSIMTEYYKRNSTRIPHRMQSQTDALDMADEEFLQEPRRFASVRGRAGGVHWQYRSFPSFGRGFDSHRPLQSPCFPLIT